MAIIEENEYEQEDFEQAAHAIAMATRDYPNFRRHMTGYCKVAKVCTSPMCPLDGRLSARDRCDAKFICAINKRKPVKRQMH